MIAVKVIDVVFSLLFAPFLLGVINRTKAVFAGRKGQPLLQAYYDIWRLFHKGAVYSHTTSWVFRAGPVVGLATAFVALMLVPVGSAPALVSFPGDFVLVAYLLGLGRMFTVLAALDTGSAFEGMGASREVQFSMLAEVGLLFGLATLAWKMGSLDASSMFVKLTSEAWRQDAGVFALLAAALLLVLLAECSRIPVDDPNTHLELTMIHEVMVLDHSGPDFGMILYGAALKFLILGTFLVRLVLPFQAVSTAEQVGAGGIFMGLAVFGGGLLALSVCVGVIESTMARLRLLNVPKLLMGSGALSFLAMLLSLR